MSTDKLIKRIINGDVSAFDLLYEQTRKSVYYVALSVLRDKRLAEDVMQSTYIKVLQNVSRYRLGTNASAWIVKIARNEALNMRKIPFARDNRRRRAELVFVRYRMY